MNRAITSAPLSVTGISFVPKEIGEHLVNIKKNGRHIPSSPIAVMINQSEIGDASRVRVSGQGLSEARTFEPAEFIIDTREAGTSFVKEHILLKMLKVFIFNIYSHYHVCCIQVMVA